MATEVVKADTRIYEKLAPGVHQASFPLTDSLFSSQPQDCGAFEATQLQLQASLSQPGRLIVYHCKDTLPVGTPLSAVDFDDTVGAVVLDTGAADLKQSFRVALNFPQRGRLKIRKDQDGSLNGNLQLLALFPSTSNPDVPIVVDIRSRLVASCGWSMIPGPKNMPMNVPTSFLDGRALPGEERPQPAKKATAIPKVGAKKPKAAKKKSAGKPKAKKAKASRSLLS